VLGVPYRTAQKWLAWYRQGDLAPVVQRRRGGGREHPSRPTAAEEAQLIAASAMGRLHAIGEALLWVDERLHKGYTYLGMRSVFRRLRIGKKVPRPRAQKASEEAQDAWRKTCHAESRRSFTG
jgi:hypothetical protein